MISRIKLLYTLKIIIATLLFYLGVLFESTKGSRFYLLLIFFVLYNLIGLIRLYKLNNKKLITYLFFIDIALIFIIENNSRFLINYFFHSLYIIILLESSLMLLKRDNLIVGIVTVIVSLIKYFFLVYYDFNYYNISQMAFFTLINIFVVVVVNFSLYHRDEKVKKDELYKELLETHRELKEYVNKSEKLTIIEERTRIARDIHDTLGHNMTGVIMQLEMVDRLMDEDIGRAKDILIKAKETSREGLAKIREVVETLNLDSKASKGLNSIEELIKDFSNKTGVNIVTEIDKEVFILGGEVNIALYKVIQEALTNAVRHGKANYVKIDFKKIDDNISFKIVDNGIGCENIKEGFGLKTMMDRIKSFGGKVIITSKEGFIIEGNIPMVGDDVDKNNNCR